MPMAFAKPRVLVLLLAGMLLTCTAFAEDRVNSASWLAFYESLAAMKRSLGPDEVVTLNQDLGTIDAYFLGRYLDGLDAGLGDLQFKSDLSGLDHQGIHALAVKYKARMDKLTLPVNKTTK